MASRRNVRKSKFENRVRFNWGFHDAVSDFRNGRGRIDGLTAASIVDRHFDKAYAHGYAAGWYEAKGGASQCDSSEGAWKAAQELGNVTE